MSSAPDVILDSGERGVSVVTNSRDSLRAMPRELPVPVVSEEPRQSHPPLLYLLLTSSIAETTIVVDSGFMVD
jgi:hypothetical protein